MGYKVFEMLHSNHNLHTTKTPLESQVQGTNLFNLCTVSSQKGSRKVIQIWFPECRFLLHTKIQLERKLTWADDAIHRELKHLHGVLQLQSITDLLDCIQNYL